MNEKLNKSNKEMENLQNKVEIALSDFYKRKNRFKVKDLVKYTIISAAILGAGFGLYKNPSIIQKSGQAISNAYDTVSQKISNPKLFLIDLNVNLSKNEGSIEGEFNFGLTKEEISSEEQVNEKPAPTSKPSLEDKLRSQRTYKNHILCTPDEFIGHPLDETKMYIYKETVWEPRTNASDGNYNIEINRKKST